jgi:hypothetical protein
MEQRRIEVLLHQGRCGKNSQRKLWQLSKLLIFLTAALFTLRTFGAEINWRVRGKVLFDPHRFLSNKSPFFLNLAKVWYLFGFKMAWSMRCYIIIENKCSFCVLSSVL